MSKASDRPSRWTHTNEKQKPKPITAKEAQAIERSNRVMGFSVRDCFKEGKQWYESTGCTLQTTVEFRKDQRSKAKNLKQQLDQQQKLL